MKGQEDLLEYEASYEEYKKKRRNVDKIRMRNILVWLVLLPVVVPLGLWIYKEIEGMPLSNIFIWPGICLEGLIMGYVLLWIPCVMYETKGQVRQINFDMNLKMMKQGLQEEFGLFQEEKAEYTVLQHKCCSDAVVEHNQCLAWRNRDIPFLIHRARITNGRSGEDSETYFDGIAVSVPAEDVFRKNHREVNRILEQVWIPRLTNQIEGKPMLSIDEFENREWLTLGFHGLHILENDVPENNLRKWNDQSQKNIQMLKHMLTMVCNITPESCDLK